MNPDISKSEIIYNVINLEQRSDEWISFREGKIGASDVASILGISPWETPLQCWERMIFNKKKEVSPAMQKGIDRENEALEWFNQKNKTLFKPMVLQSKEYPFMIASLDGIDIIDHLLPYILEIKWPSLQTHLTSRVENIPEYYFSQMQMQFYISGAKLGWYLSCWGEERIVVPVARDQNYINAMIPQILAFRSRLIDFRPPEACSRDTVHINDYELSLKAERYCELDRLIGDLEREREEIRKELIDGCDHPRSIIGPVKVVKVVREGAISYKDIPALQGMDLSPYRKKPIESYRITYE